jgi:hypothetical protein
MEVLNWVSDHWILTIALSLIASATYSVPRMVVGIHTANVARDFGR